MLAGCSRSQDRGRIAMTKTFEEIDSTFVTNIASANSNELLEISNEITLFSNAAMQAPVCPTNFSWASNQLDYIIDDNLLELSLGIRFLEQAWRAKRGAYTNQLLQSKLAWFYTNITPDADDIISNDVQGITSNLMIHLYAARNEEVLDAGLKEAIMLVDQQMNNNATQDRAATPKPYRYAVPRVAPVSREQTPPGIPAGVYESIKAAAVAHWPNDYEMQAYTIKEQCAAYLQVNP
jgi:hypothetical protein